MGSPLDALFPRRCAGCGAGPWPFCAACRDSLVPLSAPWCLRCGSPALLDVPRCRDCPPEPVTSARAPFLFAGPARSAIHRLKFAGWRDVAGALSRAMVACDPVPPIDAVTWVPLARRRLSERGFDQARALAVGVARTLDRPSLRLIERRIATGPQAKRQGADRRTALQGAFAPARSVPERVLLIDDVLTTGSTAAACADALVRGGASEVHVLVAARALHAYVPALR